jgi:general secretion pathway protein K
MITMLWVMTVGSVVALAGAVAGRTTVSAARNRVQAERAIWTALGCARRAQAFVDGLLNGATTLEEGAVTWRTLDRRAEPIVRASTPQCGVRFEAAGARLDVNAASDDMIVSALRALGESDGAAAAMADALADWRDSDDVERPAGAERGWYAGASRATPRNAFLADVRELALVRGFESMSRFDSVFTTEPGRISLAQAPVTVLMAIPGFTRETADAVVAMAEAGTPVRDVAAIVGRVSTQSADALMARYPEVVRLTTPDPDAWLLSAHVSNGLPPKMVELRWRLVRAGRRCLIVSSRTVQ